ncbi:hypothetical protein WJX73_004729 [Symbiochloris irregularis]|uniref:CBS domain-containing protein n=1 Tax=Symbiochloris irregularis TaxID=706552 RepID=A0AAW1NXH3_9CHLO
MCVTARLLRNLFGQSKALHRLSIVTAANTAVHSNALFESRECATMAARPAGARQLQVSERIRQTDVPVMVTNMRLLGGQSDVASLSQGAVYWLPPESAIRKASAEATEAAVSGYNADWGIPELRQALEEKIQVQNGLQGYKVMVTAGANQALASLMLTLMDPQDRSVMFKPYYFNALMAIQMTGGANTCTFGPCDPNTFFPDLDWLQKELQGPEPPKLVYVVSPCNPTGVTLPRDQLERLADMTEAAGAWLVIDNTYEAFLFSGTEHATIGRPNTIHVFSFSKGYGLHGWRVGYMAYPDQDGTDALGLQLVKVQDTVVIHAAVLSQKVAVEALRQGPPDTIARLQQNRQAVLDALKPLGTLGDGLWGGDAIYVFARLPPDCQDDVAVNRWLVHVHKVIVIPGRSICTAGARNQHALLDFTPVERQVPLFACVEDVMTKTSIHTCRPYTTIDDALELLVEKRITGMPVLDDQEQVVGVVSDFDMLSLDGISGKMRATGMFPDTHTEWSAFFEVQKLLVKNQGKMVSDVMTGEPMVVRGNTDLEAAARLLLERRIRRMPVVDSQGRLIGIFSRGDVIRAALAQRKAAVAAGIKPS